MQIKAAIFDMDGTLVDSLVLWDIFWQELGERFLNGEAFRPSAADEKTMRTMTLDMAMDLVHEKYHIGDSGKQLFDMVDEIVDDFYRNRVELKPGARELLEHLYAQGAKMCIASGTEMRFIRIALQHCSLEKYFGALFSCFDIGKGKDQPDVYLLAQKYLGEKAEDIWVFEDSLTAIETVKKIGMKTAAVYERFNFGQETMRKIADRYVAEGESLAKLI